MFWLLQIPFSPRSHVLGSFHCLTALNALLQAPAAAVAAVAVVAGASPELAMIWKARVETSATAPKMWKTMGYSKCLKPLAKHNGWDLCWQTHNFSKKNNNGALMFPSN